MEKNKNSEATEMRDIAVSVEKTMADFLESMRLRDELTVRIGKRTSQIIRVGAITVSLLSLAIMYLTASLSKDMVRMVNRMDEISITMQSMNTSMTSVPAMATSVGTMSRDVNVMTQQMHYLNSNVGSMGYDVNRMSTPMRMIPMP
ncbi:MAG: hypothetical protein OQK32_01575 [Gammaproteobacteria bacterium]|nr:hypothetical protein [Gammaproteobacteria bacterium]MCW8923904.1 hypothetical protein [Gammaproteobacteria bacterium]